MKYGMSLENMIKAGGTSCVKCGMRIVSNVPARFCSKCRKLWMTQYVEKEIGEDLPATDPIKAWATVPEVIKLTKEGDNE